MGLVVVALLLLLPVLEIFVIISVGSAIGAWPTFALIVAISLIGAWLVRREGRRAWSALREAVATGRPPERELADTPFLMLGGVLLLIPGFITDVVGLVLVLPFTRPLARRLGHAYLDRRARRLGDIPAGVTVYPGTVIGDEDPPGGPDRPGSGPVIRGEIIGGEPPEPRG
ncbi:MAG TPA: FxsA family protein [Streptosporangiaceae bacterium]|jgi:UPF0716 protein FxsA